MHARVGLIAGQIVARLALRRFSNPGLTVHTTVSHAIETSTPANCEQLQFRYSGQKDLISLMGHGCMQIPMGPLVRDTYVENTELCRMLIRTGFSCCGALFTMVIIPGVDVILGKEPEVQSHHLLFTLPTASKRAHNPQLCRRLALCLCMVEMLQMNISIPSLDRMRLLMVRQDFLMSMFGKQSALLVAESRARSQFEW